MELQFQMEKIPCLHQVKGELQTQEQTQELRLPEGMPDVGRVMAVWGHVVVRGKEWRGDSIGVNCGVTVSVLYAPEDGSRAQCVEAWIPMSFKWDIPDTGEDGRILCWPRLKSSDARVLSGRKLMLRATVGVLAQAYAPCQVQMFTPSELPGDIQLQQKNYPVCLVREAGEKAFMLDEDLTLPPSAPGLEKIVRCSLQPEVSEKKVLGDKAVFRGTGLLHILYRTEEGAFHSWDFEIPFSQYTELEQDYGNEAQVEIFPVVTSLEMENGEQGRLRLKAGLSGQYVLYDSKDMAVVEDAYSPDRTVTVKTEDVEMPAVLDRQSQQIRAEQTAPFGGSRIADVAFYPGNCRKQRNMDAVDVEMPAVFQVLYYDSEGILQAGSAHWQGDMSFGLAESAQMDALCGPSGKPQASGGEDSTVLRSDVMLNTLSFTDQKMPMVSAIVVGEATQKDPARPSLILRRAGHESLWDLAKKNGSTVDAIRKANDLQGDPDPDKMLLIPVL